MPTLSPPNTRSLAQNYLTMLRTMLMKLYGDPVQLAAVDVRQNGVVAGVFVDPDRSPFEFVISDREATYKPYTPPSKMDSQTVNYLTALTNLPLPLAGDDAYSSGFLQGWLRQDAKPRRKRKGPICTIGYRCRGGCINKDDECRIELNQPLQKQARSLVDAGKVVHKAGGTGILLPVLGAAAAGLAGFVGGMALGSYLGANSNPAPPRPARERRQPEEKKARTRKQKFEYETPPDPWEDAPAQPEPVATKPIEPKAKIPSPGAPDEAQQTKAKKQKPQPEEEYEQLPIDQGIRYVAQEVERKVVVTPADEDGTYRMNPDDIRLSPKLFQYKLPNEIGARAARNFREQGTTGALEDVEVWNPQVAGTLKVWRVPKDFALNGETFKEGEVLLAHGHHRLALAKRAEAVANADPTQPPTPGKVEKVKVEFIQADDWRQARVLGAMENIAAGAGSARDAANIFRELDVTNPEQMKSQGLSMKNRIAEEGLGLAGLNDRLWRKVTDPGNSEMTLRRASYIGQIRDPDLQDEVWKSVRETASPTDEYVKSLARTVQHQLETGQVEMRSEGDDSGQGMLFDVQKTVASLKERAEVDAYIESQISSEAAFWNRAARPQKLRDILSNEGAGDINVERSQEVSEQTSIARYLYQRGKFLQADENYSTITNSLIQAGNDLRALRERGALKTEVDEFKRRMYQDIRGLLARSLGGVQGDGN